MKQKPIKVLVLTDGIVVNKWIFDIIQFVLNSNYFELNGLVINTGKTVSNSSFFYRLLRLFDRKLFTSKTNPFQSIKLSFDDNLIHYTQPVQKQFSDWLDEECLDFIKDKNPDIILRFGFRILRGPILGIPKFGIWSLHHGDNKVNRGGPPAFWEVVYGESISGITLQQITENLDGGKVLGRAFVKTDFTSFNRNQVVVYETGTRLFKEKLREFAEDNLKSEDVDFNFYSNRLYKNPSNSLSLIIIFNFLFKSIKRSLLSYIYEQQWIISHSKTNNEEKSIYRYQKLKPPKGISWADPFPVLFENKLWLFAEEIKSNQNGKIVCFEYDYSKKQFLNPKSVIEKPYHLSYPFVFLYQDEWFMIPETGDSSKVILFKSSQFPYQWEEHSVLVENVKLYDVTPFEFKGIWYCFASERIANSTSPNDLLNLYILKDGPLGKWEKHPKSPVKIDARGGRSAGRIFAKDNKIYRPAQLGAPKYGYGIQFYEIITLDEYNYEEVIVDTILPNWDADLLATHTYNEVDGWQFIDFQRKVRRF